MLLVVGSPPHTWGIPDERIDNALEKRITPTYMGNTSNTHSLVAWDWDHPHIHGEYF